MSRIENIKTFLRMFAIRLCFVFFVLAMFSSCLTGGLLARYGSSHAGRDTATVARFNVIVTGSPEAVSVSYGSTVSNEFAITIRNESEVSVSYTLRVDVHPAIIGTFDVENGELSPNAASVTHLLAFTVSDWDAVTENMTNENPYATYPFTVTIHVEQIN